MILARRVSELVTLSASLRDTVLQCASRRGRAIHVKRTSQDT
jgi:hypothetical protein